MTEKLTHPVRSLMEINQEWIAVHLDCQNAFGSISRQEVIREVAKAIRNLQRAHSLYYPNLDGFLP